jgi:hypothetical protein
MNIYLVLCCVLMDVIITKLLDGTKYSFFCEITNLFFILFIFISFLFFHFLLILLGNFFFSTKQMAE